ncbi:hypothetical protein ACGFI9_01915 [Micromonospora sp. NPDC048930]|uniref:hypothetical protein n=1 Tax=Micromonospora sp. NPDC048930 TaxID=3364261 RepID=UPI003722F44C
MSDRRLLVGGAVAGLLAVALGGWWLSRPDLPSDWSGRDRFCAEAETFTLTNQARLTGDERVAALQAMIRSAPDDLVPDLERLAGSMADDDEGHAHPPGTAAHTHGTAAATKDSPEAVRASGERAGEFIERTCGVNLPNVRT